MYVILLDHSHIYSFRVVYVVKGSVFLAKDKTYSYLRLLSMKLNIFFDLPPLSITNYEYFVCILRYILRCSFDVE